MKTFFSILFLLTTPLLFSDDAYLHNLENPQCCCTTTCPPARPYPSECFGLYMQIDPLIWQAHVNGIGIATQTKNSTSFIGHSRVQNLHFDWDLGVRIGIGFNTTHDAWEILFTWTYWHTDASKNTHANEEQVLFPHFGHPHFISSMTALAIKSKWEMLYNILDLEFARMFWVSPCISARPFGGLRTAWINQKQFGIDYRDLMQIAYTTYCIQQRDRSWGIGIRTGIDMQWEMSLGFSMFNNFAGNLLYNYHSIKHEEKGNGNLLFDIRDFFHLGSAIFDMQIGVRYDWFSSDRCYHLGFDLGWEHHWYPGQNQFLLFVDDNTLGKYIANQGDLTIQGYFFTIRSDF